MARLLASNPEAGVRFMKGIEYLEAPTATHLGLDGTRAAELSMPGFRVLGAGELPRDVRWGCEYETWCAHPMVYCAFLLRRFVLRGGRVVRMELRGLDEAFALGEVWGTDSGERVLVNCSGNGFGDEEMFITRGSSTSSTPFLPAEDHEDAAPANTPQGQTCVVANDVDVTITRQNADGTWTFCVPRGFDGGTVVGGTKEPYDWNPEPSAAVREELLRNMAATHPTILGTEGKYRVIRDIVGRRPTRHGGIRVEAEQLGEGKTVVHAYGLGGRGYELSWGVAGAAAQLVTEHLDGNKA